MAQGNLLLSHWHLTTVSFFTTDTIFFAFFLKFLPFSPGTVHNVNGFIFALVVMLASWLAARRSGNHKLDLLGATATFAVVAFPSQSFGPCTLLGPIHMGTMLWIVLAMILFDVSDNSAVPKSEDSQKVREFALSWLPLAAALFCLTMALIGDALTLYVAILPIGFVSFVWLRQGRSQRGREMKVLGVCVGAIVCTKIFAFVLRFLNGFQLPAGGVSNPEFVPFDRFGENIRFSLEGLLNVYNANFFGVPIGEAALQIMGFCGLGTIFYCLYRATRALRSQPQDGGGTVAPALDRVSAVLCFGMLLNLICYASSTVVLGVMTVRYFVPFFIYGAILVGRLGVPIWRAGDPLIRREWLFIFSIGAFAWFYVFAARAIRVPLPPPSPEAQLSRWLQDRNLTQGYGTYWSSTVLMVESRGRVQVSQVILRDGKIAPYLWGSDDRWYRKPARFVVMESPDYAGVNEKTVVETFGPPAERHRVLQFTILVWNRDIAPRLLMTEIEQKVRAR
ncbi:MAG: hypothetical protein H7Z41_09015 [Cytophagales bacterium]|nr:hypothetical protein [Armatimonadota bacterium]